MKKIVYFVFVYIVTSFTISSYSFSDLINKVQQADTSITEQEFYAIHMGGNWGLTTYNNWGTNSLSKDYISFLKRIKSNWVGISVALFVDNSLDSTVERVYEEGFTFTDEALNDLINSLHENGFKVYLTLAFEGEPSEEFPVERWQLGDPNAAEFEDSISPENWPWATDHPSHKLFVAEFWQTYTDQAVYFGKLAESLGVEMFSLGTETERLFRTRSGDGWPNHFKDELTAMVNSVRSVYSGLLTYDMHYHALTDRNFYGPGSDHLWEDLGLDVVGVSAYFPLAEVIPTSVMTLEDLESKWEKIFIDYLSPLKARNPGKPIIFLEFGYVNSIESPYLPDYDEYTPWAFEDKNENGKDDNEETQANIYESFFKVNQKNNNLINGAFLWGHDWASDFDWSMNFGSTHTFAIRDKLAEESVKKYYAQEWDETESCKIDITNISAPGTKKVNTPVSIDVTAQSDCNSDLYYRFSMHPEYGTPNYDGLQWESMTDTEWVSKNTLDYTFTETGKYVVVVWVSDSNENVDPKGIPIAGWSINITSEECETVVSGYDISKTYAVNSPISISVNADNDCNPGLYFRYSIHPEYGTDGYDGKHWQMMSGSEWLADNSIDYIFTEPGKYIVVVWVSDTNENVDPMGIPIIGWSMDIE